MKYRVAKDGMTISIHATEKESKVVLRKLKLGREENGYLDQIEDNGTITPIYQKLKTSGKLLECW